MKSESITSQLLSTLQRVGASLFLQPGDAIGNDLRIGDVLKGRVLRHYAEDRYAVEFSGQEHVVDSSVPLSTGEMIQGRVIGVEGRIELKRIPLQQAGTTPAAHHDTNTSLPTGGLAAPIQERLVAELAARYRVNLDGTDQVNLTRQVAAASDRPAMALAGMMLAKLGMPQDSGLLNAIYEVLIAGERAAALFAPLGEPLHVQPAREGAASAETTTYGEAAGVLQESLQGIGTAGAEDGEADGSQGEAGGDDPRTGGGAASTELDSVGDGLEQRLFNIQNGGSVAHRVGTIPVWVGDRVVEVNIAMFDQKKGAPNPGNIHHSQLVFDLNLESLGHVEVRAGIADGRVRVRFLTSEERTANQLARHMEPLRNALKDLSLHVDELAYETRGGDASGTVARTVVEHIISQDSLSQLM